MTIFPVVTRELSVQARRRNTYWIRAAACLVAGFLTAWLLVVTAATVPMLSQGQLLFSVLSILAFVYCLLAGPLITADCLSAEKRDGTLGLVFLTDLKGYDVILGKLLSSSLHAVYALLAAMPMMAVALLFGGVSAGQVSKTALVLANTLFFSLAAGMFVSTISRNERKAVFGAVLMILLVTAGPYELAYYNYVAGQGFKLDETTLSASPAFAFSVARSPAPSTVSASMFYKSLTWTHVLAWALLGLSALIVPRIWKDRPKGQRRDRTSMWWRNWRFGNPIQRAARRRRLLERHPCRWLCSRERFKALSAWVLVVPLAAIGFWIHFKYRAMFYESALLLAAVIQILLKLWFAGETCNRWIEDRQSGALELLVCTPLRVKTMIRGQGMALRRQFGWATAATVVLTLVAWKTIGSSSYTQDGRAWMLVSMPAMIADLVAIRWVGMWLGLTAPGLNRAIYATVARVLCLRWVVFGLIEGAFTVRSSIGIASIFSVNLPLCWLVVAVLLDVVLAMSARSSFLNYFRTIAASPSDFRAAIAETAPQTSLGPVRRPADSSPVTAPTRWKDWLWRPGRRLRATVAIAVIFGLGGFLVYRYSLKLRIDRRLAAMQRAGYPTSIEQLQQQRPPFTNELNAAEVLESAFPSLGALQSIQLNPAFGGVMPPDSRKRLSPPARASISGALAANQVPLSKIHAASSLKAGRYAMDWKTGGSRMGLQQQAIWAVSQLLVYEVILRAEDGDVQGALASLRRVLELVRSLDDESWIGFVQTRRIGLARTTHAMQWLLSHHTLPDSELERLQNELNEVRAESNIRQVLRGLNCMALEWYRAAPRQLATVGPGPPNTLDMIRAQARNQLGVWTGAYDRCFIRLLDAIVEVERFSKRPWPERIRAAQKLVPNALNYSPTRPPWHMIGPQYVFDNSIRPQAESEARCRLALTSLAIERFRNGHDGRRPESLEELVKDKELEVLADPFDGRPIRYQKLPVGYRIYSVGADGTDNGGMPESQVSWFGAPSTLGTDITFSVER